MPFLLPRSVLESDDLAFVLAFGKLSVLEACTLLGRSVRRAESPTERVSAFAVDHVDPGRVAELAGVHKCAPVVARPDSPEGDLAGLVGLMSSHLEEKSNVSVSGYGLAEDDYEGLVRSLLDGLRGAGLKKVRLLRPRERSSFPSRTSRGKRSTSWRSHITTASPSAQPPGSRILRR